MSTGDALLERVAAVPAAHNDAVTPVLRWLLIVGPCRAYTRIGEFGGAIPWAYIGTSCAMSSLGALAGLLVGTLVGEPVTGAFVGGLAVLIGLIGWLTYGGLVIFVLWIRGRDAEDYVGDQWMRRPRRWWTW